MDTPFDNTSRDLLGEQIYTFKVVDKIPDNSRYVKEGLDSFERYYYVLKCECCNRKKKLRAQTILAMQFNKCKCDQDVIDDNESPQPTRPVGLGAIHLMDTDKAKFAAYLESRERQRPSYVRYPYK